MKALSAGLICLVASTAAWSAQPLGRFFFTPEERVQFEASRAAKQRPAPPPVTAETPPPDAAPPPQTVSYGGIVRRSDGKSMLWINNRLVDEKEGLSALNLRGRVRADGAVALQVPDTGHSIEVKVGQSVQVQTGRVVEKRHAEELQQAAENDRMRKGDEAAAAHASEKSEPLAKGTTAPALTQKP